MKKTILILMVCFSSGLFAQVYVYQAAVGSNDGTSWANAYVDLSDAVTAAQSGDEIWVAKGVYHPGRMAPNNNSFFVLKNGVSIYGGFEGSETMLDQRDVGTHLTVLSGDLNGDDVPGDFDNNRTDNVRHVFVCDTSIMQTAVLDGFTVTGGQTLDSSGSGDDRRGGGILTYGSPTIRNCTFVENFGWFGAGVYPRLGNASGFLVENCNFLNNRSGFGGGMYIVSVNRGTVRNCVFEGNFSAQRGGAIMNQSSINVIQNCVFRNNLGSRTGGGVHVDGGNPNFENCEFTSNKTEDLANNWGWGGCVTIYNDAFTRMTNCTFQENSAFRSGGVISIGFGASVLATDCTFTGNNSTDSGGAIFLQNDASSIEAVNCVFDENFCDASGGAIFGTGSQSITVENCEFEFNIATNGSGGAISLNEDTANISAFVSTNSIYFGNSASTQGGAISLQDVDGMISNCEISFNFATSSPGTGGGLINNGVKMTGSHVNILNTTLADNFGSIGSGIAQWTSDTGVATITLQNVILSNPDGFNYEVEAGSPTISSNGGNLSDDGTLTTALTGTNDINNSDPLFEDRVNQDYHLTAISPCVNTGVDANAPLFDLDGNPRVGQVDQGAYEYQGSVGIQSENIDFNLTLARSLSSTG